jgi:hypothetical protein
MPFKDRSRYQSEEWKEYQRNYQRNWHQQNKEKRLARMYETKAARKAAIYSYIQNMKNQLRCVDCGQSHPATLHFHHRNAEDKVFNISDAVYKGFGLDRIKKEMQKCIVLCANCHAKQHYNVRNKGQLSPGIAGELEELNTILAVSPEEEDAYNMQFGKSGEVE